MKAKTIKALDAVIAALQELSEALSSEASKSGSGADDEGAGEVSRPGKSAKTGGVPAAGKKPRVVPDDDGDVDESDDASTDTDTDDDDGDLPPPKKPANKAPVKPAAKTAPAKKAAGKKAEEVTLDTVKDKLTEVMNSESLGKPRVVAILKKFGAARAAELEESDYPAVVKACDKALAETPAEEGGDEDDDVI